MTMFTVLSSRQSHYESSLGSDNKQSTWPPTFGPSQTA